MYRDARTEAEMTYCKLGQSKIIVAHTGVPDVFRGQAVRLALPRRMISDLCAEGKGVIALCPFVKAQARRHPDWADVTK